MTIDDQVGEFLEHYGVKGMKWGRRTRAVGRGVVRGTKGAAKFAWKHPEAAVAIGIGASYVAGKASLKMIDVSKEPAMSAGAKATVNLLKTVMAR